LRQREGHARTRTLHNEKVKGEEASGEGLDCLHSRLPDGGVEPAEHSTQEDCAPLGEAWSADGARRTPMMLRGWRSSRR